MLHNCIERIYRIRNIYFFFQIQWNSQLNCGIIIPVGIVFHVTKIIPSFGRFRKRAAIFFCLFLKKQHPIFFIECCFFFLRDFFNSPFGVQLFKSDGDKSFQRNDHFDSVFRITVNINISLAGQTFAVKNLFDIATDFFGE